MEKVCKPVLKKAGTATEKPQKKVHFPTNISEKMSESKNQRKRQVTATVKSAGFDEKKKKKLEACKTLPKIDDLILSKESRIAILDQKIDQTTAALCEHYFSNIETVINLAHMQNGLDIFEKEVDEAQEYIERCVDEVDMSMINRMYEESVAADNLWADFLSCLEHTIAVLENDDVQLLPNEAENIELILERMKITGQSDL